ncbi:hypothetical protein U1Q18_042723, partial [Sarracenia purpurea var. burkii]
MPDIIKQYRTAEQIFVFDLQIFVVGSLIFGSSSSDLQIRLRSTDLRCRHIFVGSSSSE